MDIINFLKKTKREWVMKMNFIKEAFYFWKLISNYNASVKTEKDIEKFQYVILRLNHTIEKGMSMRNPRKGFGQKKVLHIIELLNEYITLYFKTDPNFLKYPLGTIAHYIRYTKDKGCDIPEVEKAYNSLLAKTNFFEIKETGGITKISKTDILKECNKDFESLLNSRHSIRYFSEETVSESAIFKALNLAQKTPSACNRQGWKTYVFKGKKSIELIKWQNGARGFEDEMRQSILVTANLRAFLSYEVHQAYIDGGLYAMNLINSLHSLGIGTMPLSCGFKYNKLKELKKFGIPENEVPILIIGIGNYEDNFNVAISTRKDLIYTNTNL